MTRFEASKGAAEGRSGMEDFARALADFVRDHGAWAAPIVLLLAFGESLAFISLLIPAWGALVAIGARRCSAAPRWMSASC